MLTDGFIGIKQFSSALLFTVLYLKEATRLNQKNPLCIFLFLGTLIEQERHFKILIGTSYDLKNIVNFKVSGGGKNLRKQLNS